MVGSRKRKDYHNKQRFREELKKERHKTSLFPVEFHKTLHYTLVARLSLACGSRSSEKVIRNNLRGR